MFYTDALYRCVLLQVPPEPQVAQVLLEYRALPESQDQQDFLDLQALLVPLVA